MWLLQVLLENAQRGSPPSEEDRLASEREVPRLPGLAASAPLVSVADKSIERVYVEVRTIIRSCLSVLVFITTPRPVLIKIQSLSGAKEVSMGGVMLLQGKRDARKDHAASVPSQTSILNILARASDKASGEKLSSQQIVAQSQTFILAGVYYHSSSAAHCMRRSVRQQNDGSQLQINVPCCWV